MNEIFKNLRRDNIISIFNSSLDKVRTTRTELSEITNLSFVTVSKVSDALLDLGILKQSFTTDKSASRRSRVLSVKFKYWIGVYIFEPDIFTFNICNLSLRCIYIYRFYPDDDIFFDDCIKRFIISAEIFACEKVKTEYCCGTGILVPGEYNKTKDTVPQSPIRHFGSVFISDIFKGRTFGTKPVIFSLYRAYAEATRSLSSEEERILCLFLNKEHLSCTYLRCGDNTPVHFSDFGILSPLGNTTLKKISSSVPDPQPFFTKLADIVFTLVNTVGVTKVTVDGSLYSRIDAVSKVLSDHLTFVCNKHSMIPPQVTVANVRENAMRYIAQRIRTEWFSEKILQEDCP